MNIFKVLASNKEGFRETEASAMLAWLLNPYMEHGLGFAFLRKFLWRVVKKDDKYRAELERVLRPVLRLDRQKEDKLDFRMDLEYNVGGAFIDIVLKFNKDDKPYLVFSIENKIHESSAQDQQQLQKQYDGLWRKDEECSKAEKRYIVFLVPSTDPTLAQVGGEFDTLETRDHDEKVNLGWRDDIRPIIQELLDEDDQRANGARSSDEDQREDTAILHEYTRHTLKAFAAFIVEGEEGFEGYPYEELLRKSGANPNTEAWKTYAAIASAGADNDWVGVQHGLSGLLRMDKGTLANYAFQYTSQDMKGKRNWLPRAVFVRIVQCIQAGSFDAAKWDDPDVGGVLRNLPAEVIYRIATATPTAPLFVGIRGGLNALQAMANADIAGARWGISTKEKTKQWIPKEEFVRVVEEKKVFPAVSA